MINLMHGDCLELMKDIPDGSVDMVLTDPPYGMNLKPQRKKSKFYGTLIENDDQLNWVNDFFKNIYRTLSSNGIAYIFCNHFCISSFLTSARKNNFIIKNHLIWDKGHFGMGNNWRPVHESIILVCKGSFKTKSKNNKTILSFPKVHYTKSFHPTEKPVLLLEELIKESLNENQIVLDAFMGSGSTGIACLNTNRKFIGIEKDDHYFNVAKNRIEEHQTALSMGAI